MKKTEFKNQWERDFAPLTKGAMPSYDDYRISERMLEDYLDIFQGYNSREGNLEMPYDHPFFDKHGKPLLKEIPCIRYILVGEARPRPNKSIYNECKPFPGDEKNGYFYDIRHVNSRQPWLSAPRINWHCPPFRPCPNNKIETLLCLASKGVLLLDLFPYAIRYTTDLRNKLNKIGTTRSFWDDSTNPYNLQDRIQRIGHLLFDDWDLTMVAPCVLSEYIVNPINLFPTLTLTPTGLHPSTFRSILYDNKRCESSNCGHEWKKIAVSQQAPSARLIGLSF
jgi:hypothetical protein